MIQNHIKMKMKALKPLGEEKPTVINDPDTKIKTRDTKIVDVPLPDSEPKTKTDQPSADSVQNTQDHKHCRAGSIKDGQFASKQATSLLTTNMPKPCQITSGPAGPTRTLTPIWLCARMCPHGHSLFTLTLHS